jgi:hypothetical protein
MRETSVTFTPAFLCVNRTLSASRMNLRSFGPLRGLALSHKFLYFLIFFIFSLTQSFFFLLIYSWVRKIKENKKGTYVRERLAGQPTGDHAVACALTPFSFFLFLSLA